MKPIMPDLISKVCFPLLCYDGKDDELWREDPKEFVRRSADIIQEMYSPRHAAVNFLSELCRGGKRKTDFWHGGPLCRRGVTNERPNTGFRGNRDRSRVDGALYLVGQLSDVLKREKGYKESLEDMLVARPTVASIASMVIFARKRVGLPHNLQILNSTTRKTL